MNRRVCMGARFCLVSVVLTLGTSGLACHGRSTESESVKQTSPPPTTGGTATRAGDCEPTLMLLDGNVSLQIVNELSSAKLYGAGCRSALYGSTGMQARGLVSFLRDQVHKEPQTRQSIRACDADMASPP